MGAVVVLVLNWRGALTGTLQVYSAEAKPDSAPTEVAKSVASTPAIVASASTPVATPVAAPASEANAAVAAAAKPAGAVAKGCAHTDDKLTEVVSVSANKPPTYVFVTSPVQTTVCVVDGNKNAAVLELRPNEGRSVYGSPPWQLSGNALKDAQIFFQGVRVKAPDGQEQHFKLMEKPAGP